jgi:Ice-binding-like
MKRMAFLALNGTKQILMGLVLVGIIMSSHQALAAGPAPIDLKSAAHFTILATSTTTTTGGGMINGDVGLYPAGSQGIPPAQINGTIYNGGAIAQQAELDLNAAYNAASPAALPGGSDVGAELSGQTLPGGVYQSPSGAYGINGDLTLDGGPNDVWVFQMASTLTVGVGGRVLLTGGAQARNVFWQIGSSATLNSSCIFEGTIMVYASITMNSSSTLDGRALAQNGAVTFNGSGGNLSLPAAPIFTGISRTPTNTTIVLNTSPYFLVTLQTTPSLSLPNWTLIATNYPVTNIWTFTDTNATPDVTQNFYRAFITMP